MVRNRLACLMCNVDASEVRLWFCCTHIACVDLANALIPTRFELRCVLLVASPSHIIFDTFHKFHVIFWALTVLSVGGDIVWYTQFIAGLTHLVRSSP